MFGDGGIVPDMYAKRFDPGLVCNDKVYGAEDAQRLGAFGESPFLGTATAYPGKVTDKSGMIGANDEVIFAATDGARDVEREGSTATGVRAYLLAIDPYRGIGADAFEPKKIAPPGAFVQSDRSAIEGGPVEVTVAETAVAIVVVPVVRDVDGVPVCTVEGRLPVLIDQAVMTGLGGCRKGPEH